MNEELILLKEYFKSLSFDENNFTNEEKDRFVEELRDAGELALSNWVKQMSAEELLEYVGEEE